MEFGTENILMEIISNTKALDKNINYNNLASTVFV